MKGLKTLNPAVPVAIGSAIAASACCWLPLLLIGLGVSGVGLSSWFARFRFVFLGITFAALGAAFYFTYRPAPARAAGEDACCTVEPEGNETAGGSAASPRWTGKINRFNRIALWPITVLVLALAFFPNFADKFLSAGPAVTETADSAAVHRLNFRIEGMDCAACAAGIQAGFESLPGILRAEVRYPEGTAMIEFASSPPPDIRDRIRQKAAGYRVVFGPEPNE